MKRKFTAALVGMAFLAALPAVADVQPGDHITNANRDKLQGLIPDELMTYILDGYNELDMTIVETGDYTPPQKYIEATVRFACQATLTPKGTLENYTAGQPFPYSKWAQDATNHACDLSPDDPEFALKLAWNVNYRWQGGAGLNLPHWGFNYMRNSGKEQWRLAQGEYRRTYWTGRADLLPETSTLEDGTSIEWAEFFDVKTPFDLRGTMFLLYRYTDDKEDQTWAYIPALRRVRRVAATQKSDSLLGTEITLEDFYIFAGYVWDHAWEYQGESTKLAPYGGGIGTFGRECWNNVIPDEKYRLEGQTRLGTQEEWDHCQFGPMNAGQFHGETWQKRTVLGLDDIPKQKGHPYSRKKIWYDRQTFMPIYSFAFDRAGEPYKYLGGTWRWSEDTFHESNKGLRLLQWSHWHTINVQNNNSHRGQFDNASSPQFSIQESRKYYDTTRLKRQGR